jgi:hypothetical protein
MAKSRDRLDAPIGTRSRFVPRLSIDPEKFVHPRLLLARWAPAAS